MAVENLLELLEPLGPALVIGGQLEEIEEIFPELRPKPTGAVPLERLLQANPRLRNDHLEFHQILKLLKISNFGESQNFGEN